MHFTKLNTPQLKAVTALASGQTVSAAAESAGVHRSTIYNWCRDHAEFSAALRHSKIQAAEVIDDEIRDLAKLALDTIRHILTSDKTPAATRLKAAQYVLHGVAHPALEVVLTGVKSIENEINTIAEDIALEQAVAAKPAPDDTIRRNSTPSTPATLARQNSTPRNAPCPCRSGEKFKRCCGKAAPPILFPNAA